MQLDREQSLHSPVLLEDMRHRLELLSTLVNALAVSQRGGQEASEKAWAGSQGEARKLSKQSTQREKDQAQAQVLQVEEVQEEFEEASLLVSKLEGPEACVKSRVVECATAEEGRMAA